MGPAQHLGGGLADGGQRWNGRGSGPGWAERLAKKKRRSRGDAWLSCAKGIDLLDLEVSRFGWLLQCFEDLGRFGK